MSFELISPGASAVLDGPYRYSLTRTWSEVASATPWGVAGCLPGVQRGPPGSVHVHQLSGPISKMGKTGQPRSA